VALACLDIETILSLGHQIRGSGGMFGHPRITEIGEAIEKAAGKIDLAAVHMRAHELSEVAREICTAGISPRRSDG
jgi:HPt (histidine-containing phosphotransfer) domain-containing protein